MTGQMSPSISPTILHLATSLYLTSLGLTCIPVEGVLTPEGSQHPLQAVQEWEGDGWEASGWQAGAAGQGKHGLEITLSYKGKKAQAR